MTDVKEERKGRKKGRDIRREGEGKNKKVGEINIKDG